MSRQPLGKTLLRNVIRHTDAHNKIQEEMEMWKMRGWEVERSAPKPSPDTACARGRMHCDRGADPSGELGRSRERASEHDDRDARYWTRKLYEFEAKDPDRWGHSGFKELYPEEFQRDGSTKKLGRHKAKKSKCDTEGSSSRHRKSSRKTKKKKKKKEEDARRKKDECSSSGGDSSGGDSDKDKRARKRSKSRHKEKKSAKPRGGGGDGGSGGSEDGQRRRRTHKRRRDKDSDSGANLKKKRKNWRGAGDGSSASSAD